MSGSSSWSEVPEIFRIPGRTLPQPWENVFSSIREGTIDDLVVVGQCGQSIDACISTSGGDSHYINGPAGLDHLHRLRALVDAVVIGAGTAVADNPQLTVRRVAGPNPARVVIDPNGRLPSFARLLAADGSRRIVVRSAATSLSATCPGIEVIALPPDDHGRLAPGAIVGALAERGLRRILVEGGSDTVSRFITAGCLDRLHVLVAPIIMGAGRASLTLSPLRRLSDAIRMPVRVLTSAPSSTDHMDMSSLAASATGVDVLLDCDLSAQRKVIGRAKRSK
jgi:diaminohydroxyphosphoribosylaminopyrimidine deaminase/5-amino-6-(5-phosphoribosylamino)uracil reductase